MGVLKLSNISYGSISVKQHAVSPVQNLLYIKIIHFFYTLLIFISNYTVVLLYVHWLQYSLKSYKEGVMEKHIIQFEGEVKDSKKVQHKFFASSGSLSPFPQAMNLFLVLGNRYLPSNYVWEGFLSMIIEKNNNQRRLFQTTFLEKRSHSTIMISYRDKYGKK